MAKDTGQTTQQKNPPTEGGDGGTSGAGGENTWDGVRKFLDQPEAAGGLTGAGLLTLLGILRGESGLTELAPYTLGGGLAGTAFGAAQNMNDKDEAEGLYERVMGGGKNANPYSRAAYTGLGAGIGGYTGGKVLSPILQHGGNLAYAARGVDVPGYWDDVAKLVGYGAGAIGGGRIGLGISGKGDEDE